ncbi:MAG: hypothetical protein A2Y15_00105 [Clostridiales bacterium GWF2_36_10]|nr:MAG: hypothetical protein A2Y15_00105 [Clostridiales bacterium GWF2_36_10]HAN20253.1 hypothetical protein [Clostridiales bacterium]
MKDYHIHYHIDKCADNEMTFPNIEKKCLELGINEGTILKHYSALMPNGEDKWICWYKTILGQWQQYLDEFTAYKPQKMIIHSGVETELCNEAGDINIHIEEQNKIEMVQLSVHYMINLDCLPMDLLLYPNLNYCPQFNNEEGKRIIEEWRLKTVTAGEENIICGLVNGYMNAIKRFPKVKSLAHIADGLKPLRTYLVDVDKVPINRIIEIFEPLMRLMAEKNVMWELLDEYANPAILKRANELGVGFTASADGHFLESGWGPLSKHNEAETILDNLSLRRGKIEF